MTLSWSKIHALLAGSAVLQATLWVLGGLLAAQATNWLCRRLLRRFAHYTTTELDDRLIELGRTPIVGSVLLLMLWQAVLTLGPGPSLAFVLRGALCTIAVLLWAQAGQRAARDLLAFVSQQQGRSRYVVPRTLPLFDMATRAIVLGGAFYLFLVAWDVNVGAWLASAGVLGIAVGFAAKDTLANLFAGVFIIADGPYRIGDWLVLENGLRGRVEEIGLRSTRLLTKDDVAVIIPNAEIGSSRVVNESGGTTPRCRVTCAISVAYGSDIDEVRRLLLSAVQGLPEVVLDDPHVAPRVRFRSFGESGLNFHLLVWVMDPEAKGRVVDALNSAVYKTLNAAKIEIPYPKRDLYVRGLPGGD